VVDVEGCGGSGTLWMSRAVEGTRELCQGIEGMSEELVSRRYLVSLQQGHGCV